MNDLIHDDSEVVGMNHFRREVYMRLAWSISDAIDPTVRPDVVPLKAG
jgi:hypothetical protein